jgi:hypothetical protein
MKLRMRTKFLPFLRATRALKTEKAGFIAFAQKKYGYSKDLLEEAYKYLVDALSQDGFVDDRGATSRHRRSQNARQNHQTHQSVGSRRLQLLARRGEKNEPRILHCELI